MAGVGWRAAQRVSRLPHPPLLPIVLAAALLAGGYLALTTTRYVIHNYQLHQDKAEIRREIAQLDRDHEQLVAVRDYLKSDEYIEDVARRILGLVRPGETLVVVSSSETAPPPASTPEPQYTPGAEWWKALFAPPSSPVPTPAP